MSNARTHRPLYWLSAALLAAATGSIALAQNETAEDETAAGKAAGKEAGEAQGEQKLSVTPPGAPLSTKTKFLEAGAKLLQTDSPLDAINVYLVGFHPMKNDPAHQMEAHHFCNQVNEDFAQCALFDGKSKTANLNGIEYIISEKLFNTLPEGEKKYWHPHNYEILSGQLIAPGIPGPAAKELFEAKMNSYGKTWHVWNSHNSTGHSDNLPLGEPMLAWSFNHDGEAAPGLAEARDRRAGVDSQKLREERAYMKDMAKPQQGVNAMEGKFKGPLKSVPGVVDVSDAGGEAKTGTDVGAKPEEQKPAD